MSWSSGKDSALALHQARSAGDISVTALLVTMNADADRVAMHAVRRTLLEAQAAALGLPLHLVLLPSPCPNDVYEAKIAAALQVAADDDVTAFIFGDLFLEDIRSYREQQLQGTGVDPLFPLWGRPTEALAREMLDLGIAAILTCVDPQRVPASFAGRRFDEQLLADLPPEVDPCGENGEFHTVVLDAPGFAAPLQATVGDVVERDGFVFCDVIPQ